MARSISEINQQMIDAIASDNVLSNQLTSTSAVSIWRLWLYIIAVAHFAVENIYDFFRAESDDKIAALKPHSIRWYALKAKAFMYGFNLISESDTYDTTGLDETDIANSKIIAQAAVVEQERGLRIKVAKTNGQPLLVQELDAFKAYMEQIKDAGVKLLITSGVADNLQLRLKIFYNPLVLNNNGERLDGTAATPIQDAVKTYLKNLPFNGVLVTEYLTDALQKVDGVVIPHILEAKAQYGALAYTTFAVKYLPDAGYLQINDADLIIEFEAQGAI